MDGQVNHKRAKFTDVVGSMKNSEPVQRLAAEIIVRAVADWRELIRRNPYDKYGCEREYRAFQSRILPVSRADSGIGGNIADTRLSFEELRRFFRSGYCLGLLSIINTDISGETILKQLEAERISARKGF